MSINLGHTNFQFTLKIGVGHNYYFYEKIDIGDCLVCATFVLQLLLNMLVKSL